MSRAQRVRTKISEDYKNAFEKVDFVVTPTAPSVAWELGAKGDDPVATTAASRSAGRGYLSQ